MSRGNVFSSSTFCGQAFPSRPCPGIWRDSGRAIHKFPREKPTQVPRLRSCIRPPEVPWPRVPKTLSGEGKTPRNHRVRSSLASRCRALAGRALFSDLVLVGARSPNLVLGEEEAATTAHFPAVCFPGVVRGREEDQGQSSCGAARLARFRRRHTGSSPPQRMPRVKPRPSTST